MSEEQPKITEEQPKITTVKKLKDPRRVEAGKRLAEISKRAKEDKLRKRIESENEQRSKEEGWSISYGHMLGLVGTACAIGALYYARRSDNREAKRLEATREEPEHVVINRSHDQKLDSL